MPGILFSLSPSGAVEVAVVNGFGDVLLPDVRTAGKVGDGARHTQDAYSTADQWQDFLNIVEMDMTPVNGIKADGNAVATSYYTTDGKQVPTPQHGINIIRYSDGTARKVLVK